MVTYEVTDATRERCDYFAELMVKGAKTWSFKYGKYQAKEVYLDGKIGEYICGIHFKKLEASGLLVIKHTPFRDNYDEFEGKDDFIVDCKSDAVMGQTGLHQVEVREKGRNAPLQPWFDCCTDVIKPHLNYWFVSYDEVGKQATIVGWADWSNLRKYARPTVKGDKNANFTHKQNEFQIQVQQLYPIVEAEGNGAAGPGVFG